MIAEELLDGARSWVIGVERKMQIASFFMVPGVQEWQIVEMIERSIKTWSELCGRVATFAQAEEEVPDHSNFVSPVAGETKDASGHSKHEASEDAGGMCRVGWDVEIQI